MNNSYINKLLKSLVSACLISTFTIFTAAENLPSPFVNSDISILSPSSEEDSIQNNGYIPHSIEHTQEPLPEGTTFSPMNITPAKYDPRKDNNWNLTEVKNQKSLGVCWSFAALDSLESKMKTSGRGVWDFSENHLRHATSNEGDNPYGFHRNNGDGGNLQMALAYFTRAIANGVVLEKDDPYTESTPPRPFSETIAKPLSNIRVTDFQFIPDLTSGTPGSNGGALYKSQIKKGILENGSVAASYASHANLYNKTDSDDGYSYHTTLTQTNHGILLVGWDDNYSVGNFKTKPEGNGAWLVKNSWGSTWGDGGYFWMSYYTPIRNTGMVKSFKEFDYINDAIYEYDPFGMVARLLLSATKNTVYFGNIFDCTDDNATLKEIMVYVYDGNTTVDIYAATGELGKIQSGDNTALLEKAKNSAKIGTLTPEYPGYYTIDITDLDVSNKAFAVMVALTGDRCYAPLETKTDQYAKNPVSFEGQSYYFNNKWTDPLEYNFCIKAIVSGGTNSTDQPRKEAVDPPEKILGDINQDDKINILDVFYLLKWLSGTPLEIDPIQADYNGDKKVDNNDAVSLLRFLVS